MKKLLGILGSIVIIGSASSSVIACGSNSGEKTHDKDYYNLKELEFALSNLLSKGDLVLDDWNYLTISPQELSSFIKEQISFNLNNDYKNFDLVVTKKNNIKSQTSDGTYTAGTFDVQVKNLNKNSQDISKETFNGSFITKQLKYKIFNGQVFNDMAQKSGHVDLTSDSATIDVFKDLIEGPLNDFINSTISKIQSWDIDRNFKDSLISLLEQIKFMYNIPLNIVSTFIENIYSIFNQKDGKNLLKNIWDSIPQEIPPLNSQGEYVDTTLFTNLENEVNNALNVIGVKALDWSQGFSTDVNISTYVSMHVLIPSYENILKGLLPDLIQFKNFMISSQNTDLLNQNLPFAIVKYLLSNISSDYDSTTGVKFSDTDKTSNPIHTYLDHMIADLIGFKTQSQDTNGGWSYSDGQNTLVYKNVPIAITNVNLAGLINLASLNYNTLYTDILQNPLVVEMLGNINSVSELLNLILCGFTKVENVISVPLKIGDKTLISLNAGKFIGSMYKIFFKENGLDMTGLDVTLNGGSWVLQVEQNNNWVNLTGAVSDMALITDVKTTNIRMSTTNAKFTVYGTDDSSVYLQDVAWKAGENVIIPMFTD